MRIFFIIISITLSHNCSGQSNLLRFEYQYHGQIWLPYGEQGAIYQDSSGAISSNSWSANLQTQLFTRKKWGLAGGVTVRKTNYSIVDRIHRWNYLYYTYSSGQAILNYEDRYFTDPVDFKATSKSLGLIGEGYYTLFETAKLKGSIGGNFEIYLLEFYESHYTSSDFSVNDRPESIPHPGSGPNRNVFLSSINTSLFYRTTWCFSGRFNLGAKIGLGTNLFSDWEQFKKYAWLEFGLEFGFNRKPSI